MIDPSSNRRVRALVVDDDALYRRVVVGALEQIPGVEVVGTANNLTIAKRKIVQGGVELLTLDVVLNGESGLELLPWLRSHAPHVVTALLTSGSSREASLAVDAMLLGVSTLVIKPSGPDAPEALLQALQRIVDGVRSVADRLNRPPPILPEDTPVRAVRREIIAIGASTGGPPVVLEFLRGLPPQLDVPLVLTQHMPALHLPYFVELLERQSGRPVRLGHEGTRLVPGITYVAPGGAHMGLRRWAGALETVADHAPEEHFCRPAVDPMFRSVAAVCGAASIGVVMTGMGKDGGRGALAMRQAGAPVVVQDEDSSVVWGMPSAVVALGAATQVVPAHALAGTVARWLKPGPSLRTVEGP